MSGDVIIASVLAHQGVVHAGPVGPGVVALLVAACVVFLRALAKGRTGGDPTRPEPPSIALDHSVSTLTPP